MLNAHCHQYAKKLKWIICTNLYSIVLQVKKKKKICL
jgi:hypothetical protein